jgi:hypothetical protein
MRVQRYLPIVGERLGLSPMAKLVNAQSADNLPLGLVVVVIGGSGRYR